LQMLTGMSTIIVEEQNKESIRKAKEWKRWQKLKFLVNLTSTSWDTWPAWWAWIEWKNFIVNIIWFPVNEATFSQQWQMLRLKNNVLSLPMNQEFSDIQEAMKNWNTTEYQAKIKEIIEKEFTELIEQYWFEIEVDSGSFNSINPWRIDGQTTYHTEALIQAEAMWIKKPWEKFIEVCPSWNGWHIYSILQAIEMYWCVDTTIVVTCNENDMFYKIFEEWRFTKIPDWTDTIHQASVSMIIKFPNNMERLFAYAFWDKRAKEIRDTFFAWKEVVFSENERKILKEKLKIHCYRVTSEDELKTIWNTFAETWRLVCPHTANALTWLQRYREEFKDNETPALVSETASPWKFLAATAAALEHNHYTSTNIIEKYNFFREYEKTKKWCNFLIETIIKLSEYIWIPIDESIIPIDLREIYKKWFEIPKVIDAKDFHNETLKFLETYAPEFRGQIMKLIDE
jgi:threonine synthase